MNKISNCVCVLSCLVVVSCATAPSSIAEDSVSVRLLDRKEITRDFGVKESENPYTPPLNLLFKPLFDFAVVSIDAEARSPLTIQIISAVLLDADGKKVAELESMEQFKDMWRFYGKSDYVHILYDKIDRSYIQSYSFTAKAGKSRRILVLRGKYPVEKPYTVAIKLLANSEELSYELVAE